jgi:hypothetical protein
MFDGLAIVGLALAAIGAEARATTAGVQGDGAGAVQRLLDGMGGRAIWARARALRVTEEAHSIRASGPARTVFYRDLEQPRIRWETTSGDGTSITVITPAGGWLQTGSVVTSLPDARVASFVSLWPKLIYTLYRRLATGDPSLTVAMEGERRVRLSDRGVAIGWIEVDRDGHLVKWAAMDNGTVLPGEEWVYGPHRQFGPISMAGWGTRVDGTYRFSYLEFAPSSDPHPASLFARPTLPQ